MFQRFFDEGLAQSSYLIACERTRRAVIVDPRRDVDLYVAAARQHGLTIELAIETHIHADFVSGARELSTVGATVIAGPASRLGYDHHEARDAETLPVGDIAVEVMHTPGHTPEHICLLVREPQAPPRVLTGDTLFVGAVGRPDLLGDDVSRRLAADLYESLFQKLLTLDDGVEVHPGHGAGSLCGSGIAKEPSSTIGHERRFNPTLQCRTKDAFVRAVLGDLPETPAYFARTKRVNQTGPPILGLDEPVRPPAALRPDAVARAVEQGAWTLDLRGAEAFGAGHVPGSLNIAMGPKVGYWAGWIVPADVPVLLILDGEPSMAAEARRQLLRVGLDRTIGYVAGGFAAWKTAGFPIATLPQMTTAELRNALNRDALTVVDVRTRKEWSAGHVGGAIHIPVGELAQRVAELPAGSAVATICEGGLRSSLAASLLARAGVHTVVNIRDGMAAWRALA